MKYTDMHSDTLTELYLGGYSVYDAPLHISLDKASGLKPYIQIGAVWTDYRLTDSEAYSRFFNVIKHFREDPDVQCGKVKLCRTKAELDSAVAHNTPAFVLAVEGARILENDITRLNRITEEGVRLITMQWKDFDCIGGAWNTDMGLTDFGKEVLINMAQYGIAADISHASDKCAYDILEFADSNKLTVCASHSNSRSVCSHRRNLTDDLFRSVKNCGGIVGLSMAPEHLSDTGIADSAHICRHLYHYLELGGEDTVCFGCDFDGIGTTPGDVTGIGDIPGLKETLSKEGFSETILNKLFFENAYGFIRGILD